MPRSMKSFVTGTWIAVGVLGVLVILMPVLFLVGNVHHATRTEMRLEKFAEGIEKVQPTSEEYREACMDAKYLWVAMGNEGNTMAVIGIGLILLAVSGAIMTTRMLKTSPSP